MPVVAPTAPVSPAPDAPTTGTAPAVGFAEALSRARPGTPPGELGSIPLADMLAVRAGTSAPTAAPTVPDAPGAVALAPGGAGPAGAILAAGERYLGVPYKWGGTDPATGFDCSGFVQRVFADLGIDLPRVSVDQARQGQAVASMADARPGDLVFWHGDGSRPNHIGIYAGDGRMLVAPRTGDVVRYQDISRTPHEIRRVA